MTVARRWLIVVAVFVIAAAGPAGSDSDPASYRLRLPMTLADGAPVQRVIVPVQALIVSQSDDMSDVRVFDANGRAVPIARMAVQPALAQQVIVPALPIIGSSTALDVTGVSLALDDQGRARIVSVDGEIADRPAQTDIVGALFDTRGQSGNVERIALEAVIPTGQPVTFVIEASEDLKTWRQLGERVVYRAPGVGPRANDETIALRGTLLRDTRLRATWRADSQLLGPVVVRKGELTVRRDATGATRTVSATASSLTLVDSYTLEFAVPFTTPILTMTVNTAGKEGFLPVRIFGRNDTEQPWALLGQGSARLVSSAFKLSGASFRTIRIVADRRTSGLTVAPEIRFGIASREIAFVASGTPPFIIAAGRASTRDVFLPFDGITRDAPSTIPRASVRDPGTDRIVLQPVDNSGASSRRFVLWAVLLAVTALLAGIAWHLWSRRLVPLP